MIYFFALVILLVICIGAVCASTSEKPPVLPPSPESVALITYFWVFAISCFGGFVSFLQKVKAGHVRAWNFVEFIGEIATSAFVGLVTFWLCKKSNIDEFSSAALIAVTAHMGSRALFLFERAVEKIIQKHFPSLAEPHEHIRKDDKNDHV